MRHYFLYFFISFVFFMQCTTVDFIPEPDHRPTYPEYSKKSWEDVEVVFSRPNKRINIQGRIKVRDFENSGKINHYINFIKKDMFRRKMDGVWIKQTKQDSVEDSIFQTMDSRGNITHAHTSEKQVKLWTGYAYRDRE